MQDCQLQGSVFVTSWCGERKAAYTALSARKEVGAKKQGRISFAATEKGARLQPVSAGEVHTGVCVKPPDSKMKRRD
jgi:hypothetical protein